MPCESRRDFADRSPPAFGLRDVMNPSLHRIDRIRDRRAESDFLDYRNIEEIVTHEGHLLVGKAGGFVDLFEGLELVFIAEKNVRDLQKLHASADVFRIAAADDGDLDAGLHQELQPYPSRI